MEEGHRPGKDVGENWAEGFMGGGGVAQTVKGKLGY